MKQKDIFLENLKLKIADGLTSIDYFPSNSISGATEEEVYSELNRMDAASPEIDLEIFPNGINRFASGIRPFTPAEVAEYASEVLPMAQQISK